MSSVFNNELRSAIKKVYTQLAATELNQKNLEKAAKLGLYYAHGATSAASDKLITDQQNSDDIRTQLNTATQAVGICNNIVTAATAAATDARNTNSLASTAAVNIQGAANSLTELWGDIASVLAIAKAKANGSKLLKLVKRANNLTEKAARNAESTTLASMNTTIEAAQSRAAESLTQARTLAKDVDTLLKALSDNFTALQAKIDADSAALAVAVKTENEQNGVYQTAMEEEKAMTFSESYINQYINHNLQYEGDRDNKGERFTLSFDGFGKKAFLLEKDEFKETQVLSEYRIIITQLDDAPAFNIHTAKATESIGFYSIKLTDKNAEKASYSAKFMTAEYASAQGLSEQEQVLEGDAAAQLIPAVARDYRGEGIQRGVPYVFFVYAVYDCNYQNEMDDTDGLLTLASLPFTLLTLLPAANKPKLKFYTKKTEIGDTGSTIDAVKISFDVNGMDFHEVQLSDIMDFRVFLFRQEDEIACMDQLKIGNFFLDTDVLKSIPVAFGITVSKPKFVENTKEEIAQMEKSLKDADKQLEKLSKGEGNPEEEIKQLVKDISEIKTELQRLEAGGGYAQYEAMNEQGDFTDNYGEPLIQGQTYAALVYSVIKETAPDAQPLFRPNYSECSAPVLFPDLSV